MQLKSLLIALLLLVFSVQAIFAQSKIERITSLDNPSFISWDYRDFIVFKNKIYFTAIEGEKGREPFVMDSTASSIKMLKDIDPREYMGSLESNPRWTVSGDNLFFIATDSVNGSELWKTDGTEVGTKMVKNISPKDTSSFLRDIVSLGNGKIFFTKSARSENSSKTELWTSDGTEAGTMPFFEVPDFLYRVASINNQIVFSPDGSELWQTDGTKPNTKLIINLKDTRPQTSYITRFWGLGDKLFITTIDSASNYLSLWVTDGTKRGTNLLLNSDNTTHSAFAEFISLKDKVFFTTLIGRNYYALYTTDGTSQGTTVVKRFSDAYYTYPNHLTVLNDKLLFIARDGRTNNQALWVSGGTEEGTQSLRSDINVTNYLFPNPSLYSFGRKAYFASGLAYDFGGSNTFYIHNNFFETDGTVNGTREV